MSEDDHPMTAPELPSRRPGAARDAVVAFLDAVTEVPPELRVQGIADQLARAFFNWTQAEGLTIVPSCRYIDVWLRRNANN